MNNICIVLIINDSKWIHFNLGCRFDLTSFIQAYNSTFYDFFFIILLCSTPHSSSSKFVKPRSDAHSMPWYVRWTIHMTVPQNVFLV